MDCASTYAAAGPTTPSELGVRAIFVQAKRDFPDFPGKKVVLWSHFENPDFLGKFLKFLDFQNFQILEHK